jgi:hypothetical protein
MLEKRQQLGKSTVFNPPRRDKSNSNTKSNNDLDSTNVGISTVVPSTSQTQTTTQRTHFSQAS